MNASVLPEPVSDLIITSPPLQMRGMEADWTTVGFVKWNTLGLFSTST